eukprot:gene12755-26865_t
MKKSQRSKTSSNNKQLTAARKEDIGRNFTALDNVLTTLARRRIIADFDKVKEGVENMTRTTFELTHFCEILGVSHQAFVISPCPESCLKYSQSYNSTLAFCVNINCNWLDESKSSSDTPVHAVPYESRFAKFKSVLDDIKEADLKKSTILQNILIRDIYNLEALREIIKQRGILNEQRTKEIQEQENVRKQRDIIESLPNLCDALRRLCLKTNRTNHKYSEFIRQFSLDMFCTENDLKCRIYKLADLASEFVSILPADDYV